jgi:Na+/melibiose symporter-like transporter
MYKDVWQLPFVYAIIPGLVGLVAFVVAVPFWSNYARKHGFKKCYWTCMTLYGIGFLPALFVFREYGFPTFYIILIILTFIGAIPYSGIVIMLMPVASDTYDEVSSKMEKRVDASLVGVRTFFFRVAFLAVGIIIPVIHIATGYDPNPLAEQTILAQWGIRIHALLLPALILIIMGLIFRRSYTLEGAEKEALVRKLKDLEIYR